MAGADSAARKLSDRFMTSRKAPVANQFALGYTYQDVLDADHEGMCVCLFLRIPLSLSPLCLPFVLLAYFTLPLLASSPPDGGPFFPLDMILFFSLRFLSNI